jgi:hypothetical protein
MNYKDKLKVWNSTEKYLKEVDFLCKLITPDYHTVLDWGCGLGNAMIKTKADGFDVNNLYEKDLKYQKYYLNVLPEKYYYDIYFLHSFAHLNTPEKDLRIISDTYPEATITVITPNAEWLDKDYVGDETVIKHFTQQELCNLFIESGYTIQLVGQFGEYKNGTNERIFLQATL